MSTRHWGALVWLRQAPNDPDGQCIVEYRAVIGNGCDQPIDIAARHQFALDALCNALDLDDRYIVSLTLEKRIDPLHPRPEVELGPALEWCFDREHVVLDE